ncbi:potassium channel family protein [Bradyrhizobium sp. Arg314]
MFVQLLLAGCLISITVAIQAMFMSIGLRRLKFMEANRRSSLEKWPTFVIVVWIIFLTIPIVLDVLLWALLYYVTGSLRDFEDAFYFSMVSFTTVGYGDVVLGKETRLIATFEAVNGWVIFGWETALVMIVVQRLYLLAGPSAPR